MNKIKQITQIVLLIGFSLYQSVETFGQNSNDYIQLQTGILFDDLNTLSRNGKLFAVYGPMFQEVTIWNVMAGRQIRSFPSSLENSIAISPDNKLLIKCAFWSNKITVCDIETGRIIDTVKIVEGVGSINNLVVTDDSKNIIISHSEGVSIIDLKTGQSVNSIPLDGGYEKLHIAYNRIDNQIIVAQNIRPRTIKFYDFTTCKLIREFKCHIPILKIYLSNDSRFIIVGDKKGFAAFDYKTGATLFEIEDFIKDFAVSPFHDELVYCSDIEGSKDNYLNLIDTRTWKKIGTLPNANIFDNSRIIFSGKKGVVLINAYDFMTSWDFNSKSSTPIFNTFSPDNVKDAYLTDNGKKIVTDMVIWDLPTLTMKGRAYNDSTKFERSTTNDGLYITSNRWSIQLYDAKGLVANFVSFKRNDWIIYTPDNYWDCSVNAGRVINYISGIDAFGIDQFATQTNRPDIILKRIPIANPDAVAHFEKFYKKRAKRMNIGSDGVINISSLPKVIINQTEQKDTRFTLQINLSSNEVPLKSYNIYLNDVPIFGSDGKSIQSKSASLKETIELIYGMNKIEVSCTNQNGVESARATTSTYVLKPLVSDIYFLGFGVSKYKNPNLNLKYAAKDVLDLEKVIKGLQQEGVNKVYTKIYTDEEVTPSSIEEAKTFLKKAKTKDFVILFIAGHGLHDNDSEATYYYLTSNADLNNLKATAANFESIEDLLQGIAPMYKVFLMDACESGEIDEDDQTQLIASANISNLSSRGFKNTSATVTTVNTSSRDFLFQKDRFIYNDLKRRSGAIVLSSSKGGELSYERNDIENGLFTEYIMRALTSNEADENNDKIISIDELRDYVLKEVAKASGGLQHPTIDRDNIYQKFGFVINFSIF
jgi:hypothetical protein